MANRTVKDATSVKGTNPQYLVEKIIRTRIYECQYWKEECFALTAELLVDKAMELKYVGGVYGGNIKPTPFLCLILKMLQIQPEKDIVVEFITQGDFKYVRVLGALYMRLTGDSIDCYKYLEPLYLDYRKVRIQNRQGAYDVIHVDEFIDELLREERVCDVILPRIQKRRVLEETNQLEPRTSALDDDLDEMDTDEEEEGETKMDTGRIPSPDRRGNYKSREQTRGSSPSRYRRPSPGHRRRSVSRERDRGGRHRHGRDSGRDRDRDRERERDRDRDRDRDRRRSRSRDRHRHRSRSRSRDRDRGHRRDRHDDDDRKRHKSKKSKRDRDDRDRGHHGSGGGKMSKEELEIQEANELRAKLGMAPLRP